MPHEPKRRHSRERKGKRRAAISLVVARTIKCQNCQGMTLPHTVCKICGFYKGKEVFRKQTSIVKSAKQTETSEEVA